MYYNKDKKKNILKEGRCLIEKKSFKRSCGSCNKNLSL